MSEIRVDLGNGTAPCFNISPGKNQASFSLSTRSPSYYYSKNDLSKLIRLLQHIHSQLKDEGHD